MKLLRLELSGFKSFADSVELPFDDGVTSIVGPNGCGKSNISDAVRWVLGEQRARLLRSARMDEVIFQGSIKRRPVNLTEVSLVFDNSTGVLGVPYTEVAITRRLTRAGQSEYLLNQAPVRLKDIQDALRGTGLGSDAGVVIEAQMIDRLLSDRADERRSLFEEAAGIGLYRDRKSSTERRLEKTGADLQRLDDLIGEVQTQVRSLARQRGRAERHRTFTEERFGIVMTLTRRALAGFEDERSMLAERCDGLRERLPVARQELAEREQRRERLVRDRAAAEARRTELERRLATTQVELERLEGDVNLAGERLANATARRARALEERQQADERAAKAQRESDAAAQERSAAAAARSSVQTELDLRTASEGEARTRLVERRAQVRDTESRLQRQAEALRATTGERTALARDLDDLRTQEQEARGRLAAAQGDLGAARRDAEEKHADLAAREREEREASSALERARHALAAAREHEAALRVERRELEEVMTQRAARREALLELERRREGLQPGARELLRVAANFPAGSILGPLSDFLTLAREDALTAERLLGDWLHAVLVRDLDAVEAVRRWHASADPGPLVLLPISPGPVGTASAQASLPAAANPPAQAWATALLAAGGRVQDEGDSVLRANGAVYLPGGTVSGPLTRRAELEQLAGDLEELEGRLTHLLQNVRDAADAHATAERDLESATERHRRAGSEALAAQGASDDARRALLRAEREVDEASETKERTAARVTEAETRLQQLAEELAHGEAERERLAEELASLQASLAELEAAQEAARERRVHWQVEEAQVSAREETAREWENRARTALEEAQAQHNRLDVELQEIDERTRALTQQQGDWSDAVQERRTSVQELEVAAQEAERAVTAATEAVASQERSVERGREELEQMSEELHRVELSLSEAEGRRRALVERIEAEWHRPLDALLREAPDVEGETETLRADAERLLHELERIGPVNALAVQEHAEESQRLSFLQGQRDDLVAARDALQQALKEIDETARGMFVETFAAVRQNFRDVFQTLFEGGECDVRLADEGEPLESPIEIHAAPRGKRIQRIHLLSSGERALVAISLLFAIYLTKPAPFCLLDEVDAPLDDANVLRFVRLLDEFKSETQFIVITHNPRTMQVADAVYGVTMQEPGVSTIVGVRLGETESAVT
jgi:chromosome segregation protein